MAYYCAMESKSISVINGCEKGGSVSQIKKAVTPEKLERLAKGYHMFMDNLSGDLFTYDKEKLEWQPVGNVGMHYFRAEASIQGGIESMKKTRVHQSNSSAALRPVMIMTSDSDIKCELKKNLMSHWILKGIFFEFIVENVNVWDPHPINIVHPETIVKTYSELATGERGPQVAEHFNTIVTQFPIKSKHKETVKLL